MTEQRSADPDRQPQRASRRAVLAGGAAIAASLAGCTTSRMLVGDTTGSVPSTGEERRTGSPVSILAAGSLQLALGRGLQRAVSAPLAVEAHGSVTAARLVAEGVRAPDVVALADTALFDSLLASSWHAVFASNAIVLAYNEGTAGGQRIAEAGSAGWYRPLLSGGVRLGRTDPDLDPLGYRTLFALELAARYYDRPGLRRSVPTPDQIYPETSLVSRLETGELEAAFVYRNMAVERDYAYVELPDEVDLSNPAYVDDWYATVAYTVPDGTTVRGDRISYGATVLADRPAAADVFRALVGGDYLGAYGFLPFDDGPRFRGDVPARFRD